MQPGFLYAHPAPARLTTLTDAVIRFHAPAAGAYDVSIQLKAADLGYGGTNCRVIKDTNSVLASHRLPRHYGSHWEFSSRIYLADNQPLSLCIGPSDNGDHASDETRVQFRLRRLSSWESLSASLSTGASLTLLAALFFLFRFLHRRNRRKDTHP